MCVFVCVFSSFRVVVVVVLLWCVLWCGCDVVVVWLLCGCCGVVVFRFFFHESDSFIF